MRRLVQESRARRDVVDQVDYFLAKEAFMAADTFITAFDNFCALVSEQPEIGRAYPVENPGLAELGLRAWPLGGGHRHIVFYYLTEEEIRIFRVLHGSRNLDELLS